MKPNWLIATLLIALPLPVFAQDTAAQVTDGSQPTVEEIIAKGRELYRAPGTHRGCKPAEGNEIVVCARSQDSFRTDSSLDDAIREGRSYDDVPRAPDLVPPCPGCKPMGGPPKPPLIIDLDAIPEALTPEDAERVHAAPPGEATP